VRGNADRYDTDAGIPTLNGRIPRGVDRDTRYNTDQDELRYHSLSGQLLYSLSLGDSLEIRESFSAGRDIYRYFSTETLSTDGENVDREFFFFKRHWFPLYNQLEAHWKPDLPGAPQIVIGHGYGRLTSFSDRSSPLPDPSPVSLRNPVDTQGPVPVPVRGRDHLTRQVHSGFLDARVELGDALSLSVGTRYDHHNFDARRDQELPEIVRGPVRSQREDVVTYHTGAVYRFSDSQAGYASYTTGFVPVTVLPEDRQFFDPEQANQVEVGYRLQNSWLAAHVAAYRIRKQDILIPLGENTFTQAGRQSSRGIETELELQPAAGWSLRLGYAYTRSRFDDFREKPDGNEGFTDYSGNRARFVPGSSATLFTTYALTDELTLGLGGRWLTQSYADLANDVEMPGYWMFDASLWYRMGSVRLGVHLRNALDEDRYFTSTINGTQLTPGPPRELLVQIDYTP
jgi:iron complex outermembrane recepter protein